MQPLNAFQGLHALILLLRELQPYPLLVQPDVCEKPFLPNIFYFAVEQFEIKKKSRI